MKSPERISIVSGFLDNDTVAVGTNITVHGKLDAPLVDIYGNTRNDTIQLTGTATNTGIVVIEGALGDDTISNASPTTFSSPVIIIGDKGSFTYDAANRVVTEVKSGSPGTGGSDILTNTGNGSAILIGGHAADTITGSAGPDTAIAGEATIAFSGNQITQITVTGTDTGAAETINAGDATSRENIVIGGTGADNITAGDGRNVIIGDEGQVTFDSAGQLILAESTNVTNGAADNFTLGQGNYFVIAGAGNETIALGPGNNFVVGDQGRYRVNSDGTQTVESIPSANGGNDTITFGSGNSVVIGGSGEDTIQTATGVTNANGTVLGDNGTLLLSATGTLLSAESNNFTDGARDVITLSSGTNTVIGGVGNDDITTGDGQNTVLGDDGKATFHPSGRVKDIESINLGVGGVDTINLAGGTNTVVAGAAADVIRATSGTNTVLGDEGRAEIDDSGFVTLLDTLNHGVGANDNISLAAGTSRVLAGAGMDVVSTTGGDNVVFGDEGKLTVAGGKITIETTPDSSNVVHGASDDIDVGSGTNIIVGGAAADEIDINGTATDASAVVLGDNGKAILNAATGTLESIESTFFTDGATDTINISAGTNAVVGGQGGDQITAGGGQNTIIADDGSATFYASGVLFEIESTNLGNGGDDTVTLQGGTNAIVGGAGADTITATDGINTILGDEGEAALFADQQLRLIRSTNPGVGGKDIIDLQNGVNNVIAGFGNDQVTLGDGTNFVLGDEGQREVITSGPNSGQTIIQTQNGLTGGMDTISLGTGYNVGAGGANEDTITVNGTTTAARGIVLGDNGRIVIDTASGNLLEIESTEFTGGANDVITLTAGTNAVIGGQGNDQITADAGQNTIVGDDGRATFFASGNLNTIESLNQSNGGNDTCLLYTSPSPRDS